MSDVPPADLIDRTVKAIGGYFTCRFVNALRGRTRQLCAPDSPAFAAQLKEIEDLHFREMDAKVEARDAARLLAPELERIGEDSTDLLRLLHFIDGGGGPDNANPLWPDLKVSLQRLAIRSRANGDVRLYGKGPALGKTPPSKEEREVLVRDYLAAHKDRAGKGEMSIREIARETGVPQFSIQKMPAWRALQDGLEKRGLSKRPRRRKAQAYTAQMDSAVDDSALKELIKEQAADDDGSPLDKGRRGKTRVQKRF